MSRETYAEAQIPAATADIPYPDHRTVARGLMGHVPECFVGEVTGAGGTGGNLTGVPFEPAYVKVINADGATPAVHESIFSTTPAHITTILAVAQATADMTKTKVGDNDWTVGLPTGQAPDSEVVVVLVFGVRDTDGGL